MNIDKKIKKSLDKFVKQTGLKCYIQTGFFLLSINEPFDGTIVIEIGKVGYPFLVRLNQNSERKPKSGSLSNILEMGSLSAVRKKMLQETKAAYIADDGDFFIPLTISNINSSNSLSPKAEGSITSALGRHTFPSSVPMAKFIHYLTAKSQMPKRTQQIMANEVGISPAAVNKYLKELEEANYIVNDKQRIRFVDPGKILELWTVEYTKRLLPRTEKKTFNPHDEMQFKELRVSPMMLKSGYWSAAKAADMIIKSELPERFIIYSDKPTDVMKELRLRPSESGQVEVRQKFWSFDWKEARQGIVNLPLIYADLVGSGDPRDMRIAKDVRELWIKSL